MPYICIISYIGSDVKSDFRYQYISSTALTHVLFLVYERSNRALFVDTFQQYSIFTATLYVQCLFLLAFDGGCVYWSASFVSFRPF